MVNNTTNINKANNHLKQLNSKKKDNIWSWKSRSWFGTGTNMWLG